MGRGKGPGSILAAVECGQGDEDDSVGAVIEVSMPEKNVSDKKGTEKQLHVPRATGR